MPTRTENMSLKFDWSYGLVESSEIAFQQMMEGNAIGAISSKVTEVISKKMNVNINKLVIESKEGLFEGNISVMVHRLSDVDFIQKELKKIKNITTVARKEE